MLTAFSLLAALGAALGLFRVGHAAPLRLQSRWLNEALLCLALSLLGARLGYVLLNLPYYQQAPLEALQVWAGGLSAGGALAGALLGAAGLTLLEAYRPLAAGGQAQRRPPGIVLLEVLDRLGLLIAPLGVALWLGCWQAGCAYGAQSAWGLLAPDEGGAWARRVPVQLLAALSLLGWFFGLEWLERRLPGLRHPAWRAPLALLGLALNLLVFTCLRADPEPRWLGLRPDAWAGIALTALSLGLLIPALRSRLSLGQG